MGMVVPFGGRHASTPSTAKKSGRIFSREMPVSFSTWKTRTNGTPRSAHLVIVDLSTEHLRAKSECRRPFSARSKVSGLVIDPESCTTHNTSQGTSLRKPLSTGSETAGILATMPKALPKRLPELPVRIYAGRQPARPHYLGPLLKRHNVTRATLIEELGIDKSLISRWLDEERPATPGRKWADKLGWYFAPSLDPEDFVDIFTNPAVSRFQRLTRGLSEEQVDQMLASLEAAFKVKKTGPKS